MSSYDQHQPPTPAAPPTAYPAPGQGYPLPTEPYPPASAAPPPAGYPVNNGVAYTRQVPMETKARGDGFWKGCCAALCCCCVLESCF